MHKTFDKLNPADFLKMYGDADQDFWYDHQSKNSLALFRKMAKGVPAYADFLKRNGINPSQIKNFNDLKKVPTVDKKNYFRHYRLRDMAWKKGWDKESMVVTATTGSTGEPTYFPRTHLIDWEYSILAEMFLKNGRPGSTLLVNCFGMGIWVGGVITYQAFRIAGLRGCPVSIVTPGINKEEIFGILRKVAPQFDNVILSGYPPFIKDLLDEAASVGIDLHKMHLRILFAAESFTESFRDYVMEKSGIKDPYHDTLNIYGSAELGAMAWESPTAIFLRRLALENPSAYAALFNQEKRLPTLAQFNPVFASFEEENGEVLITADNIMPFMRYKIGDTGGVLSFNQIKNALLQSGVDVFKEAKKAGVRLQKLPFVFVYERSDFTVSFYGANIFPQQIKHALLRNPVKDHVTGKFSMQVKFDRYQNEYLEIVIELAKSIRPRKDLEERIQKNIIDYLLEANSEYANNHKSFPKRNAPKIILMPHESAAYFKPGVKQKWTIR